MAKDKTKVRILAQIEIQGKSYLPNQAVSLPSGLVKQLERNGHVDSNAAAVTYVIKEGAELIEHEDTDEAAEASATPAP